VKSHKDINPKPPLWTVIKYLGGHQGHPVAKSTNAVMEIHENSLEIHNYKKNLIISIPYNQIQKVDNMSTKKVSVKRPIILGLIGLLGFGVGSIVGIIIGLLWKKKHIYTIIEFNDGRFTYSPLFDFSKNMEKCQPIIFQKMLTARSRSEMQNPTDKKLSDTYTPYIPPKDILKKEYTVDNLTKPYTVDNLTKPYTVDNLTKPYTVDNLKKEHIPYIPSKDSSPKEVIPSKDSSPNTNYNSTKGTLPKGYTPYNTANRNIRLTSPKRKSHGGAVAAIIIFTIIIIMGASYWASKPSSTYTSSDIGSFSQDQDSFTSSQSGCDPSYPDSCIPSPPPDLDCGDVGKRFTVTGSDPHGFDRDADGVGCE
jgi:hypothetical protein